jgi:hypothetical protein
MNTQSSRITTILLILFAVVVSPFRSHAEEQLLSEKAKIEALISYLETLQDATFVRNGSDYTSKNAAKFLRAKWSAHEEDAKTAAEFITKLASGSSSSGKPYTIRFKDGSSKNSGEVLTAQLKKLEAKGK